MGQVDRKGAKWTETGSPMLLHVMDLSSPYSVTLSKNEGPVLRVLARTRTPLSGREVARLGGGPKTSLSRALKRLAEHGLVEAREAGSGVVTLYSLNRKHLAAEPVLCLLNLRQTFIRRLSQHFEEWQTQPYHASLFGSAARGDGNTKSDIDLFVIRPADVDAETPSWRDQLYDLQERVLRWTGNHAGIVEPSLDEFKRLKRDRPPVVAELGGTPSPQDIFRAEVAS